jgi:hypothetical protein
MHGRIDKINDTDGTITIDGRIMPFVEGIRKFVAQVNEGDSVSYSVNPSGFVSFVNTVNSQKEKDFKEARGIKFTPADRIPEPTPTRIVHEDRSKQIITQSCMKCAVELVNKTPKMSLDRRVEETKRVTQLLMDIVYELST